MVLDDGAAAGGWSVPALRSLSRVTTSGGGCSAGGAGSAADGGGGVGSGSVAGDTSGVVESLWDGEGCCLMSTTTASRTIAPIGIHATLRHDLRVVGGNDTGAGAPTVRVAGNDVPADDGRSPCLLTPV